MLKAGDKIGLVACSNSKTEKDRGKLEALTTFLKASYQIEVVLAPTIFVKSGNVPAIERAKALMTFYEDPEIKAIFDISGGDLANQTLPLLNYEKIAQRAIPFIGYSDLTVILNAITKKARVSGVLFQILQIMEDPTKAALHSFETLFFAQESIILHGYWRSREQLKGKATLIGGNIRCFLKLAGTPFFPEVEGKVLLLESASGGIERVSAYFSQLEQMQVFDQIAGLIVGDFSELREQNETVKLARLLEEIASAYHLPIFHTPDIGHQPASTAVPLGKEIRLDLMEN